MLTLILTLYLETMARRLKKSLGGQWQQSERSWRGWCYAFRLALRLEWPFATFLQFCTGTNVLGHIPGTKKPCAKRGVIRCVVPFGTGEVDYNSYM
jgi:hypothetical protein